MKNYTTKSGLQMMQEELHHLSTVEYKNAIEMLQEARDKGDLSENAEYEAYMNQNNICLVCGK